jgi:hypothetical protein
VAAVTGLKVVVVVLVVSVVELPHVKSSQPAVVQLVWQPQKAEQLVVHAVAIPPLPAACESTTSGVHAM